MNIINLDLSPFKFFFYRGKLFFNKNASLDYNISYTIEKINSYKSNCGCNVGSIFVLVSVIVYILKYFLPEGGSIFVFSLKLIFLIFCSGLIGKVVGIIYYRIRATILFIKLKKNFLNS